VPTEDFEACVERAEALRAPSRIPGVAMLAARRVA
jgi:hypothetical protein